MTFHGDRSRVRKNHGPQNLATLRNISHNMLRGETSLKVGIQGKRLQAGWREDYLLKVLLGYDAIALGTSSLSLTFDLATSNMM